MPRQSIALLTLTVAATSAIASNRFVTAAGAQAGAAANTLGISKYAVQAGEDLPVTVLGTEVVEAGGAIAADAAVETDADGRAVTQVAGPVVARTLQAAAQAGDFIEVLLIAN